MDFPFPFFDQTEKPLKTEFEIIVPPLICIVKNHRDNNNCHTDAGD